MAEQAPQVIYKDSTGQPITGAIRVDGKPKDLTGNNVRFFMREMDSELIYASGTATIDVAEAGQVHYDWEASDIDTPGEFMAWWRVVDGSVSFDTDEFLLVVAEHSPGLRTRTGAIYRRARSYIPITWDALEDSYKHGDALLQERIENIKLRVFGSTVAVEDEEGYDPRILDFLAKLSVVNIIPSGVDYWLDKRISISVTQGTNQIESYPDRIDALWKLQERLRSDIAEQQAEIEELLGTSGTISITSVPAVSAGVEDGFVTPLPQEGNFDYGFNRNKRKSREYLRNRIRDSY